MKNRNNEGFTLVEMLVCIAIVAALSLALGVGATNALNSSYKADYAATFKELFKNANIYIEYSASTCNLDSAKTCYITLGEMVSAGLVDSNYYKTRNPYKKEGNFNANDKFKITLTNGRKTTSYTNTSCGVLDSKNIDDFNRWGEC